VKRFSDEYISWINSKEWAKRRAGRLIAQDFSCERCGSNVALQVHHKTYKRLRNERDEDLEVLCGLCHRQEHSP
jgi:5-methylcytosine-specific restriction endonuclease McrA